MTGQLFVPIHNRGIHRVMYIIFYYAIHVINQTFSCPILYLETSIGATGYVPVSGFSENLCDLQKRIQGSEVF